MIILNRERLQKAITCAPLLPPPGDEEVREIAQSHLALTDRLTELHTDLHKLEYWEIAAVLEELLPKLRGSSSDNEERLEE